MREVHLVRHAQPDWALIHRLGWPGAAADLAPLTEEGIKQAAQAAVSLREVPARVVVSSPMTRAMQTASILSARLGLPLEVTFDLREWVPHTGYRWEGEADVLAAYRDMIACEGVLASDSAFAWEPLAAVRSRALAALEPHLGDVPIIAVCHEVVIHSLTGEPNTPHASTRVLHL